MTDDETITLRVTFAGGCPDDYQAFWGNVSIGRIMKTTGYPTCDGQWSWVLNVNGLPSLGRGCGHGDDLDDCTTKFMAAWMRIRSRLTEPDIAKARGLMGIRRLLSPEAGQSGRGPVGAQGLRRFDLLVGVGGRPVPRAVGGLVGQTREVAAFCCPAGPGRRHMPLRKPAADARGFPQAGPGSVSLPRASIRDPSTEKCSSDNSGLTCGWFRSLSYGTEAPAERSGWCSKIPYQSGRVIANLPRRPLSRDHFCKGGPARTS